MKISVRKVKDVAIIDLEGKVVLGDGDVEIKQAIDGLLQKGTTNVLLNMAKVLYVDSAGLGEIIRCFTAVRKSGGNLKLISPNQRVVDLLNITKLLNVFDIYDNEASAVKSYA
jgi:anti-sigma B factor antagonist